MKTEEYKWHKIEDGDLPTDEEMYVLHTKTPGKFLGWYHDGKWWKPGYSRYENDEVIAWYNVPEFKDTQFDEYVDLGLTSGTLWAKKNVGAKTIESNGDYFTFNEAQKEGNIPTMDQFIELKDECNWTWKGKGYEIIGPNGNSIYIPASGYNNHNDSSCGCYWSSTTGYYIYNFCLYFNKINIRTHSDNYINELSVRLVKKNNKQI